MKKKIEKSIKKDFKRMDIDYNSETIKAFACGSLFVSQLYREPKTQKENNAIRIIIKEFLEEAMDLSEKLIKH